MSTRPLTVAWFSFFPVEWLPDAPAPVRDLPRKHPTPWLRVLLDELGKQPNLRLHIIALRKHYPHHFTFTRGNAVFHLIKPPPWLRAPSLFYVDTLLIRRALRTIQPEVVHAIGTEYGASLVATRLAYPAVITVQGILTLIERSFRASPYERAAAWMERWALRRARLVTAESRFSSGWLRREFPGLDVRHVEVVTDWCFHQVPRRPQLHPRRFLFVADLGYRKGGDVALEALRLLANEMPWELVVVGMADAELLARFRAVAGPDVSKRVTFRQNLSSEQLADELSQAAVMLCPTRLDTGPTAVKSAVVAGVPVVASDVGGVPDYVVPGKNGFLFPVGDVQGCVEAIRAAMHHPLMGQGLVDADTLAAKREYLSPARMAGAFLALYRELAGRSG